MPVVSALAVAALTVVAVPVVPARMPVTVLVSPLSTSVSLVNTLPVGLVPAVPLSLPPASVAVAVLATATGASLVPLMVTVMVWSTNAPL